MISLDWKQKTEKNPVASRLDVFKVQENYLIANMQTNGGQVDTVDRQLSTRIKKLPVNRSRDFLWGKEV
ncbi:hypothetical protein B7P43_G06143 [Cryptotermes secundus]|uniref:Uncharacterized protein n=1 Tax=Cryptotermes secundus TaxID=105785 RepID=A0A2J7QQ65_9NEOP|nr:hypothetical protein B7P43_G06143 [Cryptotermes secundus]